jgi:glycosyltransferase involved in cell wall biosynthesis
MPNWELVAVLDNCTDGSRNVLEELGDTRIRVMETDGARGIAAALNRGLEASRAQLIARLDADDACQPHRLERQLTEFQLRPQLGLLGSSATLIDGHSRPIGVRNVACGNRRLERLLVCRSQFIHPSVMFSRRIVLQEGGYDPRLKRLEDYDLWLRLMGACEIDNLPEPLIGYRVHAGQHSRGPVFGEQSAVLAVSRRKAAANLGLPGVAAGVLHAAWSLGQLRGGRARVGRA